MHPLECLPPECRRIRKSTVERKSIKGNMKMNEENQQELFPPLDVEIKLARKRITAKHINSEIEDMVDTINGAHDIIDDGMHMIRDVIQTTCGLNYEEFTTMLGEDVDDPKFTGMIKLMQNYGKLISHPKVVNFIVDLINGESTPSVTGGDSCPF